MKAHADAIRQSHDLVIFNSTTVMFHSLRHSLIGLLAALLCNAASAQTTSVQWLGQAAFKITSPGGKVIIIDPWLTANPVTPAEFKNLSALGKPDVLLVTHGHGDHVGDAPELAKTHQVPLYGPGDLNSTLVSLGVLPANLSPRFNKTGTVEPAPGIQVTAVHADHSSNFMWKNPTTGVVEAHYGGEPVGYIITMENGFKIWHMGDTGLFGDMGFIAQYYKPDLVMMPIGGNFTLGPVEAAYAAKELIKAKDVIPMHYGANPLAKGTAAQWLDQMKGSDIRTHVMRPGETLKF
jgi:L-ascorbate metabolism protein UlaG (beta-lactamase superfamily)